MSAPATGPSPTPPRRAFPKPASHRDRDSIINSSAKGWSPLQIHKRDSPLKQPSTDPTSPNITAASPRRTSSSFKHVTKNSLVSNSPFKSSVAPIQSSSSQPTIHEQRAATGYVPAKGVSAAPPAVVGLGISATRSTSSSRSRSTSGNGSAAAGQRKVSAEKKIIFPADERKVSLTKSSNSENESPDVRSTGGRKPRASMGLKGLAKNNLVSRSPFLERDSPDVGGQLESLTFSGPSPEKYDSPYGKSHLKNSTSSSPGAKALIQKDDVFSSPSPARPQRQTSNPTRRTSRSSLDSPDRLPRGVSPAAPSPLGLAPPDLAPSFSSANQVTPTKSSITSRRLRGPRTSGPQDTPTSARKTVTFKSIPHVREYEKDSVDGSVFDDSDVQCLDEEWEDEEDSMLVRDTSLDALVMEDRPLSKSTSHDTLDDAFRSFSISQSQSDLSLFSHGQSYEEVQHDESATADFVHTLIEEGLFSPPQMATPAFEDQPSFANAMPERDVSLGDENSHPSPPFLDTPSMGESIHGGTPFMESMAFDEAGIPYGRTHHAERAAFAHSLPPTVKISPLEQPDLPQEGAKGAEHMLFNADAAQPSIAPRLPSNDEPHARQDGPMPDPFITIQTITQGQSAERSEGGIPLGRTSHAERTKAARLLATQGLGIGMPRSPATLRPAVATSDSPTGPPSEDGTSISGSSDNGDEPMRVQPRRLFEPDLMISPEEEEILRKQRERDEMLEMETRERELAGSRDQTKRTLPKPPKPVQLRLPSPVRSPEPVEEPLPRATSPVKGKKFDLSVPFSLPFIGITSPLFKSDASTFEQSPALPSDEPLPIKIEAPAQAAAHLLEEEHKEPSPTVTSPLTPPRHHHQLIKEDSPHHIPDFNFEPISLDSPTTAKAIATPLPVTPSKPTLGVASPARPTLSAAISSSSLSVASPAEQSGSTNTRVRQRISREMIRKTLEQRKADGSLSKRSSRQAMSLEELEITPELTPGMDLPPPLPAKDFVSSSSPVKRPASQTTPTKLRIDTVRPSIRPRSQTQSAHDILIESQRNGELDEPKSALDRLMRGEVEGASDLSAAGITRHDWMKAGPSANDLDITDSEGETTPTLLKVAPSLAPAVEIKPSRSVSKTKLDSGLMPPPKVPEKPSTPDALSAREAAINARRKEKGGREVSSSSRVSRRRSMSTGDVGDEQEKSKKYRHSVAVDRRLTLGIDDDASSFVESFREETSNIGSDRPYKLRPERPVVQASSDDKVKHNKGGDLDSGRAWRQLRRPSDMNEYAAEIRAMKSKDSNAGKAFGNIFVKVLGIEGLSMPIPEEKTHFCITLDNGIDYIRTPFSVLAPAVKVDQEFSLVEHPNFEFTLSMEIRRDPHIMRMSQQAPERPASLAVPASPASKSGGLRSLFASPRKASKVKTPSRSSTPVPPLSGNADNISKYFASTTGSTVAKTHVAFKSIAKNCDAKVLEIRYPMFAMFKGEAERGNTAGGPPNAARKQVAKITLQIFRLPPIPGLPQDKLPQSIDDCLRGMRHHAWHENLYYTSVMTQIGGDCSMPKRRMFRLIGGNLIASNEVTKKEVASIDLRKALRVVDCNSNVMGTPLSGTSSRPRNSDEGLATRPRSLRLEFQDDESIVFSCDNDEDKAKWLEAFNAMIGHIPSNPLWAELLAARRRAAAQHKSRSASSTSLSKSASSKAVNRQSQRPK